MAEYVLSVLPTYSHNNIPHLQRAFVPMFVMAKVFTQHTQQSYAQRQAAGKAFTPFSFWHFINNEMLRVDIETLIRTNRNFPIINGTLLNGLRDNWRKIRFWMRLIGLYFSGWIWICFFFILGEIRFVCIFVLFEDMRTYYDVYRFLRIHLYKENNTLYSLIWAF